MNAAGGDVERIEVVRRTDGERALRATADIREGAVILRVPEACMITADIAERSRIGRELRRRGVKLRQVHSRMAVFLALEARDPASRWRTYLASVPRTFAHHPVLFSEEDLRLMRGSTFPERLRRFATTIRDDHTTLRRIVGDLALDELRWARLVLATRLFSVKGSRALVPLADMMNHVTEPSAVGGFDPSSRSFVIHATRDLARGDEVAVSYGWRCNSRLLLAYGFCLEDNADNEAPFRLPDGRRMSVRAEYDDAQALFAFLRGACATPRELAMTRGEPAGPIGSRNERAMLHAVIALGRDALARYDTTIAEDDAILASGTLTRNQRMCVLLRRGEKRVLQAYVDVAHAALPYLRLDARALRRAVREHAPRGTFAGRYLAELAYRTPQTLEDLFSTDY